MPSSLESTKRQKQNSKAVMGFGIIWSEFDRTPQFGLGFFHSPKSAEAVVIVHVCFGIGRQGSNDVAVNRGSFA